MPKLTLADRKILRRIEFDPRATYRELATLCNLSKDTVKYRLARLEKENVIISYSSLIDYKKLGHQSYKLYLKLNGTLTQRDQLKAYLRRQRNVFAIFDSVGNWNMAVAIFAKSHEQFNAIENQLLEKFGDIIATRRFCSMIDACMYQKDLLGYSQASDIPEFRFWGEPQQNELDATDKALVKLMHQNARITLVDLATQLAMSIDGIKHRIKRLRERQIVTFYLTGINYESLGFDKYKLLIYPGVYSQDTEAGIISFLKLTPNCVNIIRTIGPWKLEAEFFARKPQEIEVILSQLNERFKGGILDIELSVLRNEEIFACKDLLLD